MSLKSQLDWIKNKSFILVFKDQVLPKKGQRIYLFRYFMKISSALGWKRHYYKM